MAHNSRKLLVEVVDYLAKHGIETYVFGGWAEELNQLIECRPHKDIDLVYFSNDFKAVDNLIRTNHLPEIMGKHFHHKRAFEYKGVLIEIFLLERDQNCYYTNFWAKKKYYWPENLQNSGQQIKTVSSEALTQYRNDHVLVQKLRNGYS